MPYQLSRLVGRMIIISLFIPVLACCKVSNNIRTTAEIVDSAVPLAEGKINIEGQILLPDGLPLIGQPIDLDRGVGFPLLGDATDVEGRFTFSGVALTSNSILAFEIRCSSECGEERAAIKRYAYKVPSEIRRTIRLKIQLDCEPNPVPFM